MANWKTGWCIGTDIENICSQSVDTDSSRHEDYFHIDNPNETRNHLGDVLRFLGNRDSDLVFLLFISKKKQNDICTLLKKTQPAISYDVQRIKKQIDFIVYLLTVVDEFMYFLEHNDSKLTKVEINMLVLLFFSTSFTKTAKAMGYHQITCRNRFTKIMRKLENEGYDNIVEIFNVILKNLNKVKKTIIHKSK